MTEKEYLTLLVSSLAVAVSFCIALIAYFNFRLNRTLNIKNTIYNEKAKLYREITKKVASLILFLQENEEDIKGSILNKNKTELDKIIVEIDKCRSEVDFLLIESWMLIPGSILNLMTKFSNIISDTQPYLPTYTLQDYTTSIENVKQQGEFLIKQFRKDLQVEDLNKKLF